MYVQQSRSSGMCLYTVKGMRMTYFCTWDSVQAVTTIFPENIGQSAQFPRVLQDQVQTADLWTPLTLSAAAAVCDVTRHQPFIYIYLAYVAASLIGHTWVLLDGVVEINGPENAGLENDRS